MSDDVPISVENVSKKFARRLRHAMWYGVCDLGREVAGLDPCGERLRTNEFWALKDVSFELKRGECLGIIGPNGAGKSTLLKLLNGIIRPTQGRIRVRGRVGALIEVGAGFHPMLTGRENIYVNGAILGMGKAEIDRKFDDIVDFADIGDFLDTPVKFYSSGMYVRLGFAIAAHLEPDILLIDEVLAVGDVAFQSKCLNAIGRLRQNGCTLLLISHNMHSVIRSATTVLFLKESRMRALGPMETVLECYRNECTAFSVLREGAQDTAANGTGAAVIEKVVFVGADGRETNEVESGQPVSVRLHYRRVVSLVRNPTLDLCICDQFGHMFYQTTNRIQGVQLDDLNARGVLETRIEKLCAAPQMLTFYLAMWNSEQTELLDWRREIPLRVTGSPLSQGQVHLEIQWAHRDDV